MLAGKTLSRPPCRILEKTFLPIVEVDAGKIVYDLKDGFGYLVELLLADLIEGYAGGAQDRQSAIHIDGPAIDAARAVGAHLLYYEALHDLQLALIGEAEKMMRLPVACLHQKICAQVLRIVRRERGLAWPILEHELYEAEKRTQVLG